MTKKRRQFWTDGVAIISDKPLGDLAYDSFFVREVLPADDDRNAMALYLLIEGWRAGCFAGALKERVKAHLWPEGTPNGDV